MARKRLKNRKRVKVFAAGCFNRIHEAHLQMLRVARQYGDELVVVLSNDAHNKKPNAVPAATRVRWIKALGLVDKVLIGRPRDFASSLRSEKPDILVLGYDQRLPDEETARAVRELGIQLVQLPWFPGKTQSCSVEGG